MYHVFVAHDRAVIYARISKDRDGNLLGVRRQEKDCRALAELKGWNVVDVLVDDDESAYVPGKRPAYARLLEGLKAGDFNAVLTYDLDRLHRHPLELEEFFIVADGAGVTDLATVAGDVNLATNDGRCNARIMGAIGRKESDDKSRRLRRKHDELAELGRWKGGPRPYGYDIDRDALGRSLKDGRLVLIPAEAEILRELARRVLAGESLYALSNDLNGRGIPSTKGTKWSSHTIRTILVAPRNIGMREHKGTLTKTECWTPVFDRDTWDEVCAILSSKTRKPAAPRSYLLTGGIARCHCGAWLHAQPKRNGSRGYACRAEKGGCGRLTVAGEPLDRYVAELLFHGLGNLRTVSVVQDEVSNASAIAGLEAQLAELTSDYYVEKLVDRASYLGSKAKLDARLESERSRYRRRTDSTVLGPYVGGSDLLRAAWPDLSFEKKRAILVAVIDHVTVGPATRRGPVFDSDRVRTPVYRY